MAAVEVPVRRPMRMQRPKSNELGLKSSRLPKGSSNQNEPFDPAELSRRLEVYREDIKLARARRQIAEQKYQSRTALERNDSGNTIQEEVEPEEVQPKTATTTKRPANDRRQSSSTRPRQTPRRKSISALRVKPRSNYIDPSLPYVPRTAAFQFASTTTPLVKGSKDPRRLNALDHASPYKQDSSISSPSSQNEIDTTVRDRRRSQAAATLLAQANVAPPRNLTTHLHALNLDDNNNNYSDAENPYILSSRNPHPHHHDHDSSDAADGFAYHARPSIKLNAKHDWSQASQYGDSARHSLHLFSHNKDRAGEYAEIAGLDNHPPAKHGGGKNKPRQRSDGDVSEDNNTHMTGEAGEKGKGERRRSSILGLFKRH